jgi:integrase
MTKRKRWSKIVEKHGVRVRLFERRGVIYRDVTLGRTVSATGEPRTTHDIKSMKHGDRQLAEDQARTLAERIAEARLTGVRPDTLTLGQLFAAYRRDRIPHLTAARQREATARTTMFTDAWCGELPVRDLAQSHVDHYCELRRSGGLIAPGKRVDEEGRRRRGGKRPQRIRDGGLDAEFRWLRSVFNWATGFRCNGRRLLVENPISGLTWPREKNPRRPVASHQRFTVTTERANTVDPAGRLRCILALARYTGRRESAICALRAEDLLLSDDRIRAALAAEGMDEGLAKYMPAGAIRWRADADKGGYLFVSPISRGAREAINAYLRANPRMGDVPLFPAPSNPTESMRRATVAKWLLRAEQKAGLPKLVGGTFHPYRRLWATERKGLPAEDVAAAGGWRDTHALRTSYLQPDPVTVLRVVENEG